MHVEDRERGEWKPGKRFWDTWTANDEYQASKLSGVYRFQHTPDNQPRSAAFDDRCAGRPSDSAI